MCNNPQKNQIHKIEKRRIFAEERVIECEYVRYYYSVRSRVLTLSRSFNVEKKYKKCDVCAGGIAAQLGFFEFVRVHVQCYEYVYVIVCDVTYFLFRLCGLEVVDGFCFGMINKLGLVMLGVSDLLKLSDELCDL